MRSGFFVEKWAEKGFYVKHFCFSFKNLVEEESYRSVLFKY